MLAIAYVVLGRIRRKMTAFCFPKNRSAENNIAIGTGTGTLKTLQITVFFNDRRVFRGANYTVPLSCVYWPPR